MGKVIDIFIPDLGDEKDVDLIEILVDVGNKVEKDDGLITLETEKASMDIPTNHSGIVKEILVEVGMKVNSGDLIIKLEIEGENSTETESSSDTKPSNENVDLQSVEKELQDISASGAQVSCQFVNEQTICSVIEEVYIPDLGDESDVDLIEVMISAGDTVEYDDGLITLETEKASMDVPAPFSGQVIEVFVKEGSKVNSGDLLAKMAKTVVIESKIPTPAPNIKNKEIETSPISKVEASITSFNQTSSILSQKSTLIYASPSVRKLAREFGVDLGFVKGNGRKGRILKDDIKAYVKEQLSKPAPSANGLGFNFPPIKEIDFSKFGEIETVELTKIQKISGPTLHRNWVSVPHITQFDEADITDMEEFRKEQNAQADDFKLSILVFVLKAVAKALKIHPRFNSSLTPEGQNLVLKKYYHIGVAVDTPNGLVVPVIKDVDRKGFKELAHDLEDISTRAREGKLKADDLQGGCFSISSLGGIGGTKFTPIINLPEVAILGLSTSEIKPVWNGEEFVPRLMLPLSLSYDHKVIDGADGARFTTTVAELLSDNRLLNM